MNSGQITICHQARFSWNKEISLTFHHHEVGEVGWRRYNLKTKMRDDSDLGKFFRAVGGPVLTSKCLSNLLDHPWCGPPMMPPSYPVLFGGGLRDPILGHLVGEFNKIISNEEYFWVSGLKEQEPKKSIFYPTGKWN